MKKPDVPTNYSQRNRKAPNHYQYGVPDTTCRTCGEKITIVRVLKARRKKEWKILNPDGSPHICKKGD